MNSIPLNLAILNADVQDFIANNLNADTNRLLLGKSPFTEVSTRELVQQIEGKKRCEKKLPLWYQTSGIYYPPKLSIEQTSSIATAIYKTKFIRGKKIADLTGGFGIDSYYFSLNAEHIIHCEINETLSAIAKHNHQLLGATNIQHHVGNGIDYIGTTDTHFDTIYIDPSRRVNTHKVFRLTDCEPDVIANLDLLLRKCKRLIIKTSPLLDITLGIKELNHISEIHIVSVKNDCKELLWIIDQANIKEEPLIQCAALDDKKDIKTYNFYPSDEKNLVNTPFSTPLNYIYEPDVTLLKAGCFKLITQSFEVSKLHQHTHLYTSKTLQKNFIGKIFLLKNCWDYKSFIKQKPINQANVISRNFPLPAEVLRKKHQLKDGGKEYLFFIKNVDNKLVVLFCERLESPI